MITAIQQTIQFSQPGDLALLQDGEGESQPPIQASHFVHALYLCCTLFVSQLLIWDSHSMLLAGTCKICHTVLLAKASMFIKRAPCNFIQDAG